MVDYISKDNLHYKRDILKQYPTWLILLNQDETQQGQPSIEEGRRHQHMTHGMFVCMSLVIWGVEMKAGVCLNCIKDGVIAEVCDPTACSQQSLTNPKLLLSLTYWNLDAGWGHI